MMKPVILFESYPDFNGSALAIYNELVERGYDDCYDLVWAVSDDFSMKTDKKIVKFFSPRTFRNITNAGEEILKRTKLIIDSNRYIYKRPGILRFHVRHGCCLKNSAAYNAGIGQIDAILTTSEEMMKCDQRIFPKQISDKFVITGMPACDSLFHPKDLYACGFIRELTNSDKKFSKIIGWMPTFRQHRLNPSHGGKKLFNYGIPTVKSVQDFKKINDVLAKRNMLLIIQMHHAQAKNYESLPICSNIKFVTEEIKLKYNLATTDLMGNYDGLITDYSSAYHEYVILDRPIALTVDDLVEYSRTCGFFVNYLDWIKGAYVVSSDKLCVWIDEISKGHDPECEARKQSMHKIHKYIDDKSSIRAVDFIINNLKV